MQDRGLITNARVFRYYVDHNGGLKLTPGDYELRPRDHIGNLMRVLRTPPSLTYTNVTFPEGFTLQRMSERLSAKLPRIDPQDFMTAVTDGSIRVADLQPEGATSLEGLLFPDTYQVSDDETPSSHRPADGRSDGPRRPPGGRRREGPSHSVSPRIRC